MCSAQPLQLLLCSMQTIRPYLYRFQRNAMLSRTSISAKSICSLISHFIFSIDVHVHHFSISFFRCRICHQTIHWDEKKKRNLFSAACRENQINSFKDALPLSLYTVIAQMQDICAQCAVFLRNNDWCDYRVLENCACVDICVTIFPSFHLIASKKMNGSHSNQKSLSPKIENSLIAAQWKTAWIISVFQVFISICWERGG